MFRKMFFIITLTIILLLSELYSARSKKCRALWVWKTSEIIDYPDKRKDFLRFLKNVPGTKEKINVVYLFTTTGMLKSTPKKIAALVHDIHKQGAQVEFLNGKAEWAIHHTGALYIAKAYIDYQKKVKKSEQFDGFQFDIEPHVLPAFKKAELRKKIDENFFLLIKKVAYEFHKSKIKTRFGLAVPTLWSEEYIEKMIKYVDYLALMDYVDRANHIILNAQKFLSMAEKAKKEIVIGLETQIPNNKWGVKAPNTFFDEGYIKMEKIILDVNKKLKGFKSFAGIALHDYIAYTQLSANGKKMIGRMKYPDFPNLVAKRMSKVKVDGSLKEWNTKDAFVLDNKKYVVYGKDNWQGKKDLHVKVQLGWNPEYLYVGINVIDDKVVQKFTNMDIVNGDHMELWIDYDFLGDKDVKVGDNDDFQLGFSPGNFSNVNASMAYWFPDLIEESIVGKIKYKAKKSKMGYDLEIAVPWSLYPQFIPGKDKILRINIDPSDTDDNDTMQETLLSTSPHRKYANPRTFRTLILK